MPIYKVHFDYDRGLVRPSKRMVGRLTPVLNQDLRKQLTKRLGNETRGHWPRASKKFTWHFNWYRIGKSTRYTNYLKEGFEIWVTDPQVAIELKLTYK